MKRFKLLILLLVIGFIAEAQPNYLPNRSRNIWIAGKFDSTLHIPSGTTTGLRTGGYDYRGAIFYRTSDSTVYVYTGTQWISVKGAGGSSDSTIFATLYRLDTAKVNIRALIDTKLNISDTANMRPRLYAGSNVTITGTYPNLTIASTGGGSGDTSSFIIDTLYNRLATVINADSLRLKSLLILQGTDTAAAVETDSTLEITVPIPTLQGVITSGNTLTKNDTIQMGGYKLSLLSGQVRTTGHSVSIKSADSVLVRDTSGNWKSLSQWNLNGGQARTGIYLNSTKTWTKQTPYVFGTKLVFSGNSWANEGYTSGTPWPTQVTNYFGKTKVIRGRDADDITGMIMRDYNSFHGRQSDSIAFCDLSYVQIMSLIVGGTPISGVVYYADGSDLTKTTNYIKGSWRSFIANYYLDIDTFSVNSLGDANFRAATTADSLNTKTAVGAIGLGSFSFTKPAGKTSVVIGTYGADGTRTNQGTVVVTNNGTEIFRKNFDSLNVANRGRDYKLKIGLNYEAIVLKDLPSASSTIEVTALNDSTRFDYIGYLVPADSVQKPLYINNIAYGAGNPGYHTSRSNIDSANNAIQEAVFEFGEYPVFINNYNRIIDSTVDINASRHLSSAGNNVVAEALLKNIVNIGYKPVITRGTATGGGSGVTTIGTYDTGGGSTDGAVISGTTLYMQKYSAENPGLVPAGFDYIDSVYRIAGKDSIFARYKEGAILAMKDSIGSGGGGSPAGNNGDIQFNRNGSFTAAGSDSLRLNGSSLETKAEFSLMGTKTINFGTGTTNPEITATATAFIFRNNNYSAYTDVTLGALAANSFTSVGNGSIGGKLSVTTGTNKSAGTGTLASGTATISTTQVTANSLIFIQYTSCSSCASTYISAKTASTSFVVTSTNASDASTFNWWIIN